MSGSGLRDYKAQGLIGLRWQCLTGHSQVMIPDGLGSFIMGQIDGPVCSMFFKVRGTIAF